jgi:putative intracellular protease/amidase
MMSHTVHLYVFDGMADSQIAFAVASIRKHQFEPGRSRYRTMTAARSLAPIATADGVRILPDTTIDEITPCTSALLILPGGRAWETGANLEALERAHAFIEHGTPVAAIGAATLALARAGLLDDRLHTSNDAAYLASSGYRGARNYREVPVIRDRNVITASGIASLEFAYEISRLLDLYASPTLEAWHALREHGDAPKFYEMAAGFDRHA